MSFSQDTADKTGQSKRNVERSVKRATDLDEEVQEKIVDHPIADNKSELDKLSREKPERQRKLADKLASGEAKTLIDAKRKLAREEVKEAPIIEGATQRYWKILPTRR